MASKERDPELRVLVYAPTGKDAVLAARVLESADIHAHVCGSMHEMVSEFEHGAGAILAMEETFTPASLKLLAEKIDGQPPWSDIAVLVVTRQGTDSPDLQTVMERLRNYTLLERPIRTRALISTVRSALNARRRQYQMRETEQRKDEFLASLAHELRNPLGPIRTSMGVLGLTYPAAMTVTQVREVVERQVDHLTRLVDDLLDVARITSGKIVLQRERVALSSLIGHVLEICAPLNKSMHKIDVQRPPREATLDVDPVRVVQSLANILGNAIKFTPAPGTISLRVAIDGDKIVFTIKDTGVGLEAEALEHIFDMFAQNNPVQARGRGLGGLGIGLSLAKRFTEMHGGTLIANSDGPGHGSEFVMTLPVVVAEKAQPQTARKLGLSVSARNRQVLVVDDNRDGADMLQRLFEADGFTVQTAYDGQQAVDAVKRARPDIVVMDIGMPGMDGYEAVRQIRLQPNGEDILIIALTGWGQDSAKRMAAEAGFDHHLVKPVNFDLLRNFLLNA